MTSSIPARIPLRRSVGAALFLVLAAWPAEATWSIVAVRRATGEGAVASATCLALEDLRRTVPAIAVGHGAAAIQSAADPTGRDRRICVEGFRDGLTPEQIFQEIDDRGSNNIPSQQFGIVGMHGDPLTFSGQFTDRATLGVAGEVDGIQYAIQGNVLAGDAVVFQAERAFREMKGDLGERIMAGMRAAYLWGGDGRCSCRPRRPIACGSPPPNFTKSAHVGFIAVARVGDTDGDCTRDTGCANGSYYMALDVVAGVNATDPVLILGNLYRGWRQAHLGRPDHVHSTAAVGDPSLPADGTSRTSVNVKLADVDGVPLGHGGTKVHVRLADGGRSVATTGPVTDHGDGTYSFDLIAGTRPGTAKLEITADDGVVEATLFPFPEVVIEPPTGLAVRSLAGAAGRPEVVLEVDRPAAPGAPFAILSLAGTRPRVVHRGLLDGVGHATVALELPRALSHAGAETAAWRAVVFDRGVRVSRPVGRAAGVDRR